MFWILLTVFAVTLTVLIVFVACGGELPPSTFRVKPPEEPDFEDDDPEGVDRWNDEGGWK